jgi:hypothetical protein
LAIAISDTVRSLDAACLTSSSSGDGSDALTGCGEAMVARAIALNPKLKPNKAEYALTRNFLAIILKIFLIAWDKLSAKRTSFLPQMFPKTSKHFELMLFATI